MAHIYRWDFPTINKAMVFHDIPLKGNYIVPYLGLMLGVGETPIPLLCSRSVFFEYTVICRCLQLEGTVLMLINLKI